MNQDLKNLIDQVSCVSFDIFDTLIRRQVSIPRDVFSIVEKMYNTNHKPPVSFYDLRTQAESLAREHSKSEEITIEEIYQRISLGNNEKKELMELEKYVEIHVSTGNKDGLRIFQYCREKQKRIVLTSDMYLDNQTIVEILKKSGITGYEKLYLSSDRKVTKRSGKLFELLLKEENINSKDVLHIGDNAASDVQIPRSKGMKVFHLPSDRHEIQLYRDKQRISVFENKVRMSIFWKRLHEYKKWPALRRAILKVCRPLLKSKRRQHDVNIADAFRSTNFFTGIGEQIGWCVLGPLLYGFSSWLYDAVQNEKPDKVLFLSRDGAIIKRAYETYSKRDSGFCQYVYASRRALVMPVMWKTGNFDYIRKTFFPSESTVRQLMDIIGVDISTCHEELSKAELTEDSHVTIVDFEENSKIKKFFSLAKPLIESKMQEEYNSAVKYWRCVTRDLKKVFIVDVGWSGSIQKALQIVLKDEIEHGLQIQGWYFGIAPNAHMHGYLWDGTQGKEWSEHFHFKNVFETFFMTSYGSAHFYKKMSPCIELFENEYQDTTGKIIDEIKELQMIQNSAIAFVSAFSEYNAQFGIPISASEAAKNIFKLGNHPSLIAANYVGDFRYRFQTSAKYLARSQDGSFKVHELLNTPWKIGYMTRYLKIPIPYIFLSSLAFKLHDAWIRIKSH